MPPAGGASGVARAPGLARTCQGAACSRAARSGYGYGYGYGHGHGHGHSFWQLTVR